MPNLISIKNLSKKYKIKDRQITALNDVSIDIDKGDSIAVVGESGSGKTTLGKLLLGLEKPTQGQIYFQNKNLTNSRTKKDIKNIQVVQQNPMTSLNPKKKILNTISLPLKIHSELNKDQINNEVIKLLKNVGLESNIMHRFPSSLSGGQRQRVAIARAIAPNPQVLLLDEPTSALDVLVQARILKLLVEIQKKLNLTYIFITHDLGVVRNLCNKVVVLKNGTIVEEGQTIQIFTTPKTEYTKNLIRSIPVVSEKEELIKP